MTASSRRRIVFDTNVVLSAVLFPTGRLAWLRQHWQERKVEPLLSSATAQEMARVLNYQKFRLTEAFRLEAMALYFPLCTIVETISPCQILCRDTKDQALLDLAHSGQAETLVTGGQDLLTLSGQTNFLIETPEAYRARTHS